MSHANRSKPARKCSATPTAALPPRLCVPQGKKARTLLSGQGARWLKVLALLASAGVLAGSVYGIVQVGAGGGTSGVESCFPALQADCEPSRLVPTTASPAG